MECTNNYQMMAAEDRRWIHGLIRLDRYLCLGYCSAEDEDRE